MQLPHVQVSEARWSNTLFEQGNNMSKQYQESQNNKKMVIYVRTSYNHEDLNNTSDETTTWFNFNIWFSSHEKHYTWYEPQSSRNSQTNS